MRRVLVAAVFLIAIFGLAAPALAQAPAPKVTINGLLDFRTVAYKNWSPNGCAGSLPQPAGFPASPPVASGVFLGNTCPGADVTTNKDRGWYSTERGVFTITGEVGRSKAVWAFELDFTNGVNAVGTGRSGGIGQASTVGNSAPGETAGASLDTDVAGALETKWLYLETPITGPGSLLPFVPVDTLFRGGMQPATGHDYKPGILLSGDFPGVTLITTWAPNLRSTLSFIQSREGLDKKMNQTSNGFGAFLNTTTGQVQTNPAGGGDARTAFARGQESWDLVTSVEMDVFKGLTVKPTYAYTDNEGGSGQSSLGDPAVNGFNVNGTRLLTQRHTLGGDVRWTAGPFYVQPTFYYQWGNQQICVASFCPSLGLTPKHDVDIRTWIIDTTVGARFGPLNLEVRGMVTPGMSALRQVQRGSDVGYYQAVNSGFSYMAGYTEIQTSGIEYNGSLFGGVPGISLRTSPSYDKYGRRMVVVAADYSLTPALTFHETANASWTDEKVDTASFLTSSGLTQAVPRHGTDRFLGVEFDTGLTYRFAPNVAFDLIGAYMVTGHAMDHAQTVSEAIAGIHHNARDIMKAAARIRITF